MTKESLSLLQSLTNCCGVSGQEAEVSALIKQELLPHSENIFYDSLGSIIVQNSSSSNKKIAVVAHIDEVGFMVRHIFEDGTASLYPLGRVECKPALGSKVKVGTNSSCVYGEIKTSQPENPDYPNLFLDFGTLSSNETRQLGVEEGSWVCFENHFTVNNEFISAKALDNRISCALAVDLFKKIGGLFPHQLYFVGSAQEEVGTRGVKTALSMIIPDICIVLDVASPKEIPKSRLMGKGISVCYADKGALGSRRLINLVKDCAQKNNLSIQYDFLNGGTDAGAAQSLNIETLALILPVRRCHHPLSESSISDYDGALSLLTKILAHPKLFCQ